MYVLNIGKQPTPRLHLDYCTLPVVPLARDLGILVSYNVGVSCVCRSAYCFLRQLRPIVVARLVHACISSRVDCCNSLAYSDVYKLCRTLLHALSPVLEGVITSHRSCSNYIGYQFKSGWNLSAVLSYKAVNNITPHYLASF